MATSNLHDEIKRQMDARPRPGAGGRSVVGDVALAAVEHARDAIEAGARKALEDLQHTLDLARSPDLKKMAEKSPELAARINQIAGSVEVRKRAIEQAAAEQAQTIDAIESDLAKMLDTWARR